MNPRQRLGPSLVPPRTEVVMLVVGVVLTAVAAALTWFLPDTFWALIPIVPAGACLAGALGGQRRRFRRIDRDVRAIEQEWRR